MAYDNRPAAAAIAETRRAFVLETLSAAPSPVIVESMARRFIVSGLGTPAAFADAFGAVMIECGAIIADAGKPIVPGKGKGKPADPSPELMAERAAIRREAEETKAAAAAWHRAALAFTYADSQPRPAPPVTLSTGQCVALGTSFGMLFMVLAFIGCIITAIMI